MQDFILSASRYSFLVLESAMGPDGILDQRNRDYSIAALRSDSAQTRLSIGAETLRRLLSDWLTDIDMISAGALAEKDGYIGYEEPHATSHQSLDEQQDVRSAALTLPRAISLQDAQKLVQPDLGLRPAKLK
jgi:hypothetical protein